MGNLAGEVVLLVGFGFDHVDLGYASAIIDAVGEGARVVRVGVGAGAESR